MVVFEQKWFFSGKSGSIREKDDVFGQSCCVRKKVVLIGQKWLYSGKSGCNLKNMVLFRQKWLYSGKSRCTRA